MKLNYLKLSFIIAFSLPFILEAFDYRPKREIGTPFYYQATLTAANDRTVIQAAPGANVAIHVTDIFFSAGITSVTISFSEDSTGANTVVIASMTIDAFGGAVMNFKTARKLSANVNFAFTSAAASRSTFTTSGQLTGLNIATHSVTVFGYLAPFNP